MWGSFEDFDVVLGAKGLDGVEVLVGKAVHLEEVVGKSTRDDGQEQLARRRADVAEGMRDVAGADGQRPRRGLDRTIAERDLEQTLQDIEDLGLLAVDVQRRPLARGHLLFQQGIGRARLLAQDLERALAAEDAHDLAGARPVDDGDDRLRLGEEGAILRHDLCSLAWAGTRLAKPYQGHWHLHPAS